MDNPASFSNQQIIVYMGCAAVPSIILSVIGWIRLGPRVDRIEREQTAQGIELRESTKCLVRLTTLQEVAERRMERLEDHR
jgi:hypothetical protein